MSSQLVSRWSIVRTADGPFLRHEASCIICCKRNRARCGACGGTGLRSVDHPLAPDDLARLADELAAAGAG